MAEMPAEDGVPLAVFRASATPEMGGGHVFRCLALADVLAERGWRSLFAGHPATPEIVPAVVARHRFLALDEGRPAAEPAALEAAVGNRDAALLVVDHYGRDGAFETACRAVARHVMAIDDAPTRSHHCDLLLDQSGGREAADYVGQVPETCRTLIGPRYALLRAAFAMARRQAGASGLQRIFVSFGATDVGGLTTAVVDALRATLPAVGVDVLLTSAATSSAALRQRAAHDPGLVLHADVEDVAAIIGGCDLAVGNAGISLWERCALEVPSLIVVVADNQRDNARHVADNGGGEIVGQDARADIDHLIAAARDLAGNPARLARMGRCARDICDGGGARRVAAEIVRLVSEP